MTTINDTANKEIMKAKRALHKAIDALMEERAYWNENDIFHKTTKKDTDRLLEIMKELNKV